MSNIPAGGTIRRNGLSPTSVTSIQQIVGRAERPVAGGVPPKNSIQLTIDPGEQQQPREGEREAERAPIGSASASIGRKASSRRAELAGRSELVVEAAAGELLALLGRDLDIGRGSAGRRGWRPARSCRRARRRVPRRSPPAGAPIASSVLWRFMITAVPSLKRSATSRASLNRFGSDLWIAEGPRTPGRGAAIVRTTPSASAGHVARPAWGRIRRTRRGLRFGHLVDEVLVFLDQPQVVQGLLPHAGHPRSSSRSRHLARHGVRAPNTAVPMRTIVAPSSHCDLVIQRHPHREFQHVGVLFLRGRRGAPGAAGTRAARPPGSAVIGAIVIRPRRRRPSRAASEVGGGGHALRGRTPARCPGEVDLDQHVEHAPGARRPARRAGAPRAPRPRCARRRRDRPRDAPCSTAAPR